MISGVQRKRLSLADRLIPAALIVLSIIPILVGVIRLITGSNPRLFTSPLPIVLHIISVSLYIVLGAFQFSPGLRRRSLHWHRVAGRLLIPSGLVVALSGLWMSHFYPWQKHDGVVLYGLRLMFGSAMFLSLLLGADAIRRRNFKQHGAWMIRAYAIAAGTGTQVFTFLPWVLFPDLQGETVKAVATGAAWVINLIVAEWLIHRHMKRRKRSNVRRTQISLQRPGTQDFRKIQKQSSIPNAPRAYKGET